MLNCVVLCVFFSFEYFKLLNSWKEPKRCFFDTVIENSSSPLICWSWESTVKLFHFSLAIVYFNST